MASPNNYNESSYNSKSSFNSLQQNIWHGNTKNKILREDISGSFVLSIIDTVLSECLSMVSIIA